MVGSYLRMTQKRGTTQNFQVFHFYCIFKSCVKNTARIFLVSGWHFGKENDNFLLE